MIPDDGLTTPELALALASAALCGERRRVTEIIENESDQPSYAPLMHDVLVLLRGFALAILPPLENLLATLADIADQDADGVRRRAARLAVKHATTTTVDERTRSGLRLPAALPDPAYAVIRAALKDDDAETVFAAAVLLWAELLPEGAAAERTLLVDTAVVLLWPESAPL
jgi:hypothetical protein